MAAIESILTETRVFAPAAAFVDQANVAGMDAYRALCRQADADYEGFWAALAKRHIEWKTPFSHVLDESRAPFYRWFSDGTLNVSYNCIDRHLATRADKPALIFEADDGGSRQVTYAQLHARVCQLANGLKSLGVVAGDRVVIYLPMGVEAVVAMQACARIGAIHSVVFGGFSAKSLFERIEDAQARLVITADESLRGGKAVPLKQAVDAALAMGDTSCVERVIVLRRSGGAVNWSGRDLWWHELVQTQADTCEPTWVSAEHPLFILYTSGSTGKPKGVQHSTGGYLLGAILSMHWVFDAKPDTDVFWCTADVGWVTGHSYIVYGPLANACTEVMFEGVPSYPDFSRFWEVIDKHQVSIFYTAPTAIRALMREGLEPVRKTSRKSLRVLGSVGEPINPEAWRWYFENIGDSRCPVVDTWWQTETGGMLITPIPGATDLKPGSASKPLPGVQPALVDAEGNLLEGAAEGNLVMLDSWPGQMRSVYGDHQRFIDTYFKTYPGMYFTGDGCRRDEDGYYWITGRVDDVINVSGHRMGTAEVESALVAHPKVSEAAVVGYPHDLKGQGIYVYVTLMAGEQPSEDLAKELRAWVRQEIGPIASPDLIQFAPGLPKTRSGKIMRRILRKIAEDSFENLGDTSTLADPAVVDDLIENRQNRGA